MPPIEQVRNTTPTSNGVTPGPPRLSPSSTNPFSSNTGETIRDYFTSPFYTRSQLNLFALRPPEYYFQQLTNPPSQEELERRRLEERSRNEKEAAAYRRDVYRVLNQLIPGEVKYITATPPAIDNKPIDYPRFINSLGKHIENLKAQLMKIKDDQGLDPYTRDVKTTKLIEDLQKAQQAVTIHLLPHNFSKEMRPDELAKQLTKMVGTGTSYQILTEWRRNNQRINFSDEVKRNILDEDGNIVNRPRLYIPEELQIYSSPGTLVSFTDFLGQTLKTEALDKITEQINHEHKKIEQGNLASKTSEGSKASNLPKEYIEAIEKSYEEGDLKRKVILGILEKMPREEQDKLIKHFGLQAINNIINTSTKGFGSAYYVDLIWKSKNGWKEEARLLTLIEIGYIIADDLLTESEHFKLIIRKPGEHNFKVKNTEGLYTENKQQLVRALNYTSSELDKLISEAEGLNRIQPEQIFEDWGVPQDKTKEVLQKLQQVYKGTPPAALYKILAEFHAKIKIFNSLSSELQKEISGSEGLINPEEVLNELLSGAYRKGDSRNKRILESGLFSSLNKRKEREEINTYDLEKTIKTLQAQRQDSLLKLGNLLQGDLSTWARWAPWLSSEDNKYDAHANYFIELLKEVNQAHSNNLAEFSKSSELISTSSIYSTQNNPFSLISEGRFNQADELLTKIFLQYGSDIRLEEPLLCFEIMKEKENPKSLHETGLLQRLELKGESDKETSENIRTFLRPFEDELKFDLACKVLGSSKANSNTGKEIEASLALHQIDNDLHFDKIRWNLLAIQEKNNELREMVNALNPSKEEIEAGKKNAVKHKGQIPIERTRELAVEIKNILYSDEVQQSLLEAKKKLKMLEDLKKNNKCIDKREIDKRIQAYKQIISIYEDEKLKKFLDYITDAAKWQDTGWVTWLKNDGGRILAAISCAVAAAALTAFALKTFGGTAPAAWIMWAKAAAIAAAGSAGALAGSEAYESIRYGLNNTILDDGRLQYGGRFKIQTSEWWNKLSEDDKTFLNGIYFYGCEFGKDAAINFATIQAARFTGGVIGNVLTNSRLNKLRGIGGSEWSLEWGRYRFGRVAAACQKFKTVVGNRLGESFLAFAKKIRLDRIPRATAAHAAREVASESGEEIVEEMINIGIVQGLIDLNDDFGFVPAYILLTLLNTKGFTYDFNTRKGYARTQDLSKLKQVFKMDGWNIEETVTGGKQRLILISWHENKLRQRGKGHKDYKPIIIESFEKK